MLTQAEVDKLPTILEVLDEIAKEDNKAIPPIGEQSVFDRRIWEEGFFYPVSSNEYHASMKFMPCSQSGLFRYCRGEADENVPCRPSLLRLKYNDITEKIVAQVKAEEFGLLVNSHPVIKFMREQMNLEIETEAICQHYGFATRMLDITNNKWTAAFFATTRWDNAEQQYHPVGRDYGDGYGIFFVSKGHEKITESMDSQRLYPIGYQFLKRPSAQSAFGFRMESGEDFSKMDAFRAIPFRHDITASNIVFNMAFKQKRYYPDDYMVDYANRILEGDHVCEEAVRNIWQYEYPDQDMQFVKDALAKKNICIGKPYIDENLVDNFQRDWDYWLSEGHARLMNKTINPILVAHL